MIKNLFKNSLIATFIFVFILIYLLFLYALYIVPNNFADKISFIMILGFTIVIVGVFLAAFLKTNSRKNSEVFLNFNFISEDLIKIILLISMIAAFFIPPMKNSMATDWRQVQTINFIRAIIYIIGSLFLPGACLYNFLFTKNELEDLVKIEPFLLKLTLFPIFSLVFIGISVMILDIIGLVKEIFQLILLLFFIGLFMIDQIIKIRNSGIYLFSKAKINISRNSFIILFIAAGVSIISLGIYISTEYLIQGDSWWPLGPCNYIGRKDIDIIDLYHDQHYPPFAGYILVGLGSLTGLPYLNTNALLAPFSYVSITSMYIFMKSILDKYNPDFSYLSTILVSIYGGLFLLYPIQINNWFNISHYSFRSMFIFDYKTITFILFYIALSFFFYSIGSNSIVDKSSKINKLYKPLELKLIILASFLLIIGYLIYMIPLIPAIYISFFYFLFSKKQLKKKIFSTLLLFWLMIILFFIIFDFALMFILSDLFYNKFVKYIFTPPWISPTLFVYTILFSLVFSIFLFFLIYKKFFYEKTIRIEKLKLKLTIIYAIFILGFTIFISIIIYNTIKNHDDINKHYILVNQLSFEYIILNIGLIGILAIYFLYFCFKNYENNKELVNFLISWILFSLIFSSISFIQIRFDKINPTFEDLLFAFNWFDKNWIFAIPAFSILTIIGGFEFRKKLWSLKIFKLNKFNTLYIKSLICTNKLLAISLILILSYSNIIIGGVYRGNTDENRRMSDAEAQVVGWVADNIDHDSNILIENRFQLYTPINYLINSTVYLIHSARNFDHIFDYQIPYELQTYKLKENKIEYAIFYDDIHYGCNKKMSNFIDGYLIPFFFDEVVYHYKDITIYRRAPNIKINGIYKATYNFIYDTVELNEWNLYEKGGDVKVILEHNGHKKVVQLFDNNENKLVKMTNSFNIQESGTIELYFESTEIEEELSIRLQSNFYIGPYICIKSSEFLYYNGTQFVTICDAQKDTFYHLRIDFECGNKTYEGLNQDEFFIYINDIKYGPFNFSEDINTVDKFVIATSKEFKNGSVYLDAVGYSWDGNYNIGDNKLEIMTA
ncbi:MAG: oligosaccharide repeat unit polymerase [Promethearchaeota archaeon]|nr:MAG: oligosaccharide repeat unit polymerase [Candidatus Lokiarchaeota archaeon]